MGFRTRYSLLAIRPLSLLQRRGQILDQIIRMLQPRGEADEAFADAERGAVFRLQTLMRRGGGMRDQALGVAEIVGDLRKREFVEHPERTLLAALHLEAD